MQYQLISYTKTVHCINHLYHRLIAHGRIHGKREHLLMNLFGQRQLVILELRVPAAYEEGWDNGSVSGSLVQ